MDTRVTCRHTALNNLGFTGAYPENWYNYLVSTGVPATQIMDMESVFLDGQLIAPGHLNTRWYDWLGVQGYSHLGSLPDRWTAFWCDVATGVIPMPGADFPFHGLIPQDGTMQGVWEGVGSLSQLSAGASHVFNSDKYWELLEPGDISWHGARYVNNQVPYSEDITNTAGTPDAVRLDYETVELHGESESQSRITWNIPAAPGQTWLQTVELKAATSVDIGKIVKMYPYESTFVVQPNYEVTLTDEWVKYTIGITTPTGTTSVTTSVRNQRGELITVKLRKWQMENVTSKAETIPSEYVSSGVAGEGAEVVPDTVFSDASWQDPTVPAGWAKFGAHDGVNNLVENDPAGMHWLSDGTSNQLNLDGLLSGVDNTPIVVTYEYADKSAGNLKVGLRPSSGGATETQLDAAVGVRTTVTLYSLTSVNFYMARNGVTDVVLAYFSMLFESNGKKVSIFHNGNTVLDNVVTEAQGAQITDFSPADPDRIELYYAPDLTNSSRGIADCGTSGTGTRTADRQGIDGKANGGYSIVQTSGYRLVETMNITGGTNWHTGKWWIEYQDDSPVQAGCVMLFLDGAAPIATYYKFDKKTGDIVLEFSGNFDAARAKTEVVRFGKWWLVYASIQGQADNTQVQIQFRPNYVASGDSGGPAETSYLAQFEAHLNKTIDQVRHCPPIFTEAAPASHIALTYRLEGVNIPDAQGTIYEEYRPAFDKAEVASHNNIIAGTDGGDGTQALVEWDGPGNIMVSDGTTNIRANAPYLKQEVAKVGNNWEGPTVSMKRVILNGISAEDPYDGSWNIETRQIWLFREATRAARMYDLRVYDLNYDDGKAKLDQLIPLSDFYTLAFQALKGAADVQIGVGGLTEASAGSQFYRYKADDYYTAIPVGGEVFDEGELVYLPAVTNLFTYSTPDTTANWVNSTCTVVAGGRTIIPGVQGYKHTADADSAQRNRTDGVYTGSPETIMYILERGTALFTDFVMSDPAAVFTLRYTWATGQITDLGGTTRYEVTPIGTDAVLILIEYTGTGAAARRARIYTAGNTPGGDGLDMVIHHAQIQEVTLEQARENSPIITAGAPVSVVRKDYRFDPVNHNQQQGVWSALYRPTFASDAGAIGAAGIVNWQSGTGAGFVYDHNTGNRIAANDGTNTAQADQDWSKEQQFGVRTVYDAAAALMSVYNREVVGEASYDGTFTGGSAAILLGSQAERVFRISDIRRYDCTYGIGKRVVQEVIIPRTPVFKAFTVDATVDEGVGDVDQLSASQYYPLDGTVVPIGGKHWDGADVVYYPSVSNLMGWSNDLTNAAWSKTNNCKVVMDQPDLEGNPNAACRVIDDADNDGDALTATVSSTSSATVADTAPITVRFVVRKNPIPVNAGSANGIDTLMSATGINGTPINLYLYVNLETGASRLHGGIFDPDAYEVNPFTTIYGVACWEVILQKAKISNTAMGMAMKPAFNDDGTLVENPLLRNEVVVYAMEVHDNKTIANVRGSGLVKTLGAGPVSLARTDIQMDLANHNDAQGAWYCEYDFGHDTTDLPGNTGVFGLRSGSVLSLMYASAAAEAKAYDGTNEATVAGTSTERVKAAVIYGSTKMIANAEGVFGTEVAYDGAWTVSTAIYIAPFSVDRVMRIRNLRRYATNYEISKQIIEGLMQ